MDKFSISSLSTVEYDNEELKSKLNALMLNWDDNNIDYDYLLNFYHDFEDILNQYGMLDDLKCKNEFEAIKNIIDVDKADFGYVGRVFNFSRIWS